MWANPQEIYTLILCPFGTAIPIYRKKNFALSGTSRTKMRGEAELLWNEQNRPYRLIYLMSRSSATFPILYISAPLFLLPFC